MPPKLRSLPARVAASQSQDESAESSDSPAAPPTAQMPTKSSRRLIEKSERSAVNVAPSNNGNAAGVSGEIVGSEDGIPEVSLRRGRSRKSDVKNIIADEAAQKSQEEAGQASEALTAYHESASEVDLSSGLRAQTAKPPRRSARGQSMAAPEVSTADVNALIAANTARSISGADQTANADPLWTPDEGAVAPEAAASGQSRRPPRHAVGASELQALFRPYEKLPRRPRASVTHSFVSAPVVEPQHSQPSEGEQSVAEPTSTAQGFTRVSDGSSGLIPEAGHHQGLDVIPSVETVTDPFAPAPSQLAFIQAPRSNENSAESSVGEEEGDSDLSSLSRTPSIPDKSEVLSETVIDSEVPLASAISTPSKRESAGLQGDKTSTKATAAGYTVAQETESSAEGRAPVAQSHPQPAPSLGFRAEQPRNMTLSDDTHFAAEGLADIQDEYGDLNARQQDSAERVATSVGGSADHVGNAGHAVQPSNPDNSWDLDSSTKIDEERLDGPTVTTGNAPEFPDNWQLEEGSGHDQFLRSDSPPIDPALTEDGNSPSGVPSHDDLELPPAKRIAATPEASSSTGGTADGPIPMRVQPGPVQTEIPLPGTASETSGKPAVTPSTPTIRVTKTPVSRKKSAGNRAPSAASKKSFDGLDAANQGLANLSANVSNLFASPNKPAGPSPKQNGESSKTPAQELSTAAPASSKPAAKKTASQQKTTTGTAGQSKPTNGTATASASPSAAQQQDLSIQAVNSKAALKDYATAIGQPFPFYEGLRNAAFLLKRLLPVSGAVQGSRIHTHVCQTVTNLQASIEAMDRSNPAHWLGGILTGMCFAYPSIQRLANRLYAWKQLSSNDEDPPAWVFGVNKFIRKDCEDYIPDHRGTTPGLDAVLARQRLVPGLLPFADAARAMFYWAMYSKLENLTFEKVCQRPEMVCINLDREMMVHLKLGAYASMKTMFEKMMMVGTDVHQQWVDNGIEDAWVDLGKGTQGLNDIHGEYLPGPFGKKEVEAWLEEFRAARRAGTDVLSVLGFRVGEKEGEEEDGGADAVGGASPGVELSSDDIPLMERYKRGKGHVRFAASVGVEAVAGSSSERTRPLSSVPGGEEVEEVEDVSMVDVSMADAE